MTLLEAFRILGRPAAEGPRGAHHEEQAAKQIVAELRRLAGLLATPQDVAEDAVSIALARMAAGVHLRATKPPGRDDEVRAYLYRALRNNALALLRSRRLLVSLPSEELDALAPSGAAHPEEELDRKRERESREAALRELRAEIVPRTAATLKGMARVTFLEAFADLEAVASGTRTLAEVLERRRSEIACAPEDPRARNWFDQRSSRARRAIGRYLDDTQASAQDRERLKRALDRLRLRP